MSQLTYLLYYHFNRETSQWSRRGFLEDAVSTRRPDAWRVAAIRRTCSSTWVKTPACQSAAFQDIHGEAFGTVLAPPIPTLFHIFQILFRAFVHTRSKCNLAVQLEWECPKPKQVRVPNYPKLETIFWTCSIYSLGMLCYLQAQHLKGKATRISTQRRSRWKAA